MTAAPRAVPSHRAGEPIQLFPAERAAAERRVWPDRLVPAVAALVIFTVFYTVAMLRHHAQISGYDVAYFQQASWLITHGETPFITVRGLYLLADHSWYVLFPVAFLTRLLPAIPTLLAVQSAGLALAVVPLYALCRRVAGLPVWTSAVVLAVYGLYPTVQNVNAFDVRPETFFTPAALIGAALFAATDRWWPYAGCIALVLLSREDLVVVVGGIGLLLLLERKWRPALLTLAATGVWFLVNLAIQAHYAGGTFVQGTRLGRYGEGLPSAVVFLVGHPWRVAVDLLTPDTVNVALALLAPVLFLPLLAPRWLLPGIPLQALYLLSDAQVAHTVNYQYTLAVNCFVFVALAMALGRSAAVRPTRALMAVLVVAVLFGNLHWGTASYFARPWEWARLDEVDEARLAAAAVVPQGVPVSATDALLPMLSARKDVYYFPAPFEQYPGGPAPKNPEEVDPVPKAVREREVRWIAVDTTPGPAWGEDKAAALERLLADGTFTKVFERTGVLVYHRPVPAEPAAG